jgi:3-deoxy-7-phosphoheptulonate synthase
MSLIIQKPLPTKKEVLDAFPLPDEVAHQVGRDRAEVCDILKGLDPRKILIIGPCSAWPSGAVLEYAKRLKPLADEVSGSLKIVMRTYIQKPRTTVGWMGPLVQPDPFGEPDIPAGIFMCREMMIEVLKIGLPISDEILFPRKQSYFRDLFAWAAIGARSSENQEHRILASMLKFPIGLKNPTSGSIKIGVNSVEAAQSPNVFASDGNQVQTSGNPFAHLVLRGGSERSNADFEHLQKAANQLHERGVQNPAIIVDASHENSIDPDGKKDPLRQEQVILDTIASAKRDPKIAETLKGWMVESFLYDGSQNLKNCKSMADVKSGLSVTDGCVGWEKTEALVRNLATSLK